MARDEGRGSTPSTSVDDGSEAASVSHASLAATTSISADVALLVDDSGYIPAPENMYLQLEGLVLMQILQHGKKGLPTQVTGQLLGMDFDDRLEVTYSYPYLSQAPETEEEEEKNTYSWKQNEPEKIDPAELARSFETRMLDMLTKLNIDRNAVGWYQSTYLGSFVSERLIEVQFNYQKMYGGKCVCLVFDPLKSMQGVLSIKAIRLSDAFMQEYLHLDALNLETDNLSFEIESIIEEVPIYIHNMSLVHAYLFDLSEQSRRSLSNLQVFGSDFYLEKNVEFLMKGIDDLLHDQNQYVHALRRTEKFRGDQDARQAAGMSMPSEDIEWARSQFPRRAQAAINAAQVDAYCSKLSDFAKSGFSKLYLLETLQRFE